jgi:His Kinase A (phospho-acceptor) domain
MPESLPSHGSEAKTPSLHPAIYGTDPLPGNVPTILVCPLPLPGFPHEQLLPELSHELKTPLAGIMGLAQVLQRDPTPRADRECQYADLIYQRSQQLLVSINDLFDLAQLCTHQFVLQLRPIELSSVVKTALKVAQHTTPADLPIIASTHANDETEFWMMGDLSRVEQLLTHLIGYFAAQSLPGSHPVLTLRSHQSWLSITLMGALQAESVQAQAHLRWPYELESGTSTMPGRSGAVLKFLLAKQLAQLHGGDVSWTIQSTLDTEVTVLLPRDLTRATLFTRSGFSQPLFLIYAPLLNEADALIQTLRNLDVWVVVARSQPEAQEKVKILSPSVLALESSCIKAPEWPALRALLTEPSPFNPRVIWLKNPPNHADNRQINVLDIWPLPLPPDRIIQTLEKLQTHGTRPPSPCPTEIAASTHNGPLAQAPRPLIVLQIDQISANPPETRLIELLACLSRDFGCSVLAADDLAQAELLAQIWRPQVMICPGAAPKWSDCFTESSALAQIPLFLLDLKDRKTSPRPNTGLCRNYLVDRNVSIYDAAQQLYQQFIAVGQENS